MRSSEVLSIGSDLGACLYDVGWRRSRSRPSDAKSGDLREAEAARAGHVDHRAPASRRALRQALKVSGRNRDVDLRIDGSRTRTCRAPPPMGSKSAAVRTRLAAPRRRLSSGPTSSATAAGSVQVRRTSGRRAAFDRSGTMFAGSQTVGGVPGRLWSECSSCQRSQPRGHGGSRSVAPARRSWSVSASATPSRRRRRPWS